MSWAYTCTDGYLRPLTQCRRVYDPAGQYWYLAHGMPLPTGWREQ